MSLSRRTLLSAAPALALLGSASTALAVPTSPFPQPVVGVGGAGVWATNRLLQLSSHLVDVTVVDSDLTALRRSTAAQRHLVATDQPRFDLLTSSLLVGGLGGQLGSHLLPELADPTSVAVVTTPFWFEGKQRRRLAHEALERLHHAARLVIDVPLQALLHPSARVPLRGAVQRADQAVAHIADAARVAMMLSRKARFRMASTAVPAIAVASDPLAAAVAAFQSPMQPLDAPGHALVHLRGAAPSDGQAHAIEELARHQLGVSDTTLAFTPGDPDLATATVLLTT